MIKLIKACKELNIGMSTAIEFCAKQGKEIVVDPNTRIDDDLYLLLAKEFNKDMALKLEADRQAEERQKAINAQQEPVVEEKVEVAPVQPKVIGKIDLDAEKKAKEAARKAAEEAKKAAEEAQKAEAERLRAEQVRAELAAAAAKEEEARKAAAEAKRMAEEEAKVFKLARPEIKNQPKVVGKIDLSAINQATHPTKKTKEEKKKSVRSVCSNSSSYANKTLRNVNASALNKIRWTSMTHATRKAKLKTKSR